MKYSHIERDETATQLQRRLSRQGAQALMQCGSLVTAIYGPVEVFITVDGGQLRMEAIPRLISDKKLSTFLWQCHAANMALSVNNVGRLSAVIRGSDDEIVHAIAQFDHATKMMLNGYQPKFKLGSV